MLLLLAATSVGLPLLRLEVVVCEFSFVMCADAPCCMMMLASQRRLQGQNASALKARIESALACTVEGTLLSDGYLNLLCDPAIAYDPDMLLAPTRV